MNDSIANPNYERTYEVINLNDPPILQSESETHFRFFCPACESKRGKADQDGKFFFSKEKLTGICFKCNTVFFPEIEDDATGRTDPKLNLIVHRLKNSMGETSFKDPSSMEFSFPDLKSVDVQYLKGRHPFLPMLAPVLGLKSWFGTNHGVVVPYLYKNYVATFQVRYSNPKDPKKKYYIPVGTEKIPYSPEHLLTRFNLGENESITICEGWADAIALWIMGFPHPLAIQGSYITEYESLIIRKLMPSNAYIVMDKYDISAGIRNNIKKQLPSLSGTKIISFGDNVDPEEKLKEDIKNPDKYKEYFINTIKILKDRVIIKEKTENMHGT